MKQFSTCILVLLYLSLPLESLGQFDVPSIDGSISVGEYGDHTNGANREEHNNDGQTWYMTWDNDNLYIAIASADITEGAVVYIDHDPITPVNGGGNSNGNLSGFDYDGTSFAELQFRADFVAYFHNGHQEYRTADGGGAWSAETTGFGNYADDGNTDIRELAIPWSVITGNGRPASFNWFGYVARGSGNGYGAMPEENHNSGNIGTSARWDRYYSIGSTDDGSATPPFSRNCYVFTSDTNVNGFDDINVFDFTMNSNGLSITRGTGAWSIAGSLLIADGTIDFGSTADHCDVNGAVTIDGPGTLSLSSAAGGDITIGGDFTVSGTFNCNDRAVYFDGNSGANAQTIGGSNSIDIDYFKHENPNDITASTLLSIDNDIDLNSSGNGGKIIINTIALIIKASATISNADALHYFVTDQNKELTRNSVSGISTFPVGTMNSYNKVVLSNQQSQAHNYAVTVCDGVRIDAGCNGGSLITSQAVDKTWHVTTNSIDTDYEFYWNGINELSGFNRNNSAINKYNGTNWIGITPFGSASGSGPYFRELTGHATAGSFGISSGILLPLSFDGLTASTAPNDNISLHWQISNPINVSHFEVEHSTDGWHFQKIGQKEFTEAQSDYAYLHRSPVAGVNYYRIRSVDFDGQWQYSHVATATVQQHTTARGHLDGRGQLHLWVPEQAVLPTPVRIYDIQGRKLLERNITSANTVIPLPPSTGLALVQVNGRAFFVK